MIDIIQSVLLGIIEGFTEFLPISSTAHLILASRLLGLSQSDFVKTFEIAIQSGAILAVLVLYWRKFLDIRVLKRIFAAFVPTAVIGFIFYEAVKTYLLESMALVLLSLALGGLFLIFFERWFKNKDAISDIKNMSYAQSMYVGLFQSIAMVPGVSRAAATIIGGMVLGMRRETIVEFSFLLAVPTMIAATGFDFLKSFNEFSDSEFSILGIGFFVSFITAIVGIRFLLRYIRTHSFSAFGVYRILLVLFMLMFMML